MLLLNKLKFESEDLVLKSHMAKEYSARPGETKAFVSVRGLITESMTETWNEYKVYTEAPSYAYGHPHGQAQWYLGPITDKNELAVKLTSFTSELRKKLPAFYEAMDKLDMELHRGKSPELVREELNKLVEETEDVELVEIEEQEELENPELLSKDLTEVNG